MPRREEQRSSPQQRKLAEVLQLAQAGQALAQPQQELAARAQEMRTQALLKVLGLGQDEKQFSRQLESQNQQALDTLGLRKQELESGQKAREADLALRQQEAADTAKARQGSLDLQAWSAGQNQMSDLADQAMKKEQLALSKTGQQQALDSKIFGDLLQAGPTASPQMLQTAGIISPAIGQAQQQAEQAKIAEAVKRFTPDFETYSSMSPNAQQAIRTQNQIPDAAWEQMKQASATGMGRQDVGEGYTPTFGPIELLSMILGVGKYDKNKTPAPSGILPR